MKQKPDKIDAVANILGDELRCYLRSDPRPSYVVARESGVAQSSLSRFLSGCDLSWSNAVRLADALGLEVQISRKR